MNNFNFLEATNAVVMICEFKKQKSIEKVLKWKEKIKEVWLSEEKNEIPFFLIANKSDLYSKDKEIFEKNSICLQEIALQNDFEGSFLVSATNNSKIKDSFLSIIQNLISFF